MLLILISFFSLACSNEADSKPRLYLDDSFYWAVYEESIERPSGINSTVYDAYNLEYKHLDKMCYRNLFDLAGGDGKILWLKAEFELSPELMNRDLSMLIPFLHYSDELYLNGRYINTYGLIDTEKFQEAGYASQLFDFPKELLNQNKINTVYIKVYALGLATISSGVFVGIRQDVRDAAKDTTFWQSRVYLPFEGGMFAAFLLFLILYLFRRKEKIYLYFSLNNLFSMLFFAVFFMGDLPGDVLHGGIFYLNFVKITRCLSFFGMEYMSVFFILEFLKIKHHKIELIIRSICASICLICVIFVPDYKNLMRMTSFLVVISVVDLFLAFVTIIIHLFYKHKRQLAAYLLLGSAPIIISLITDFIIKFIFSNINIPFISMMGWQLTILFFFIFFSIEYRRTSVRLEYLNTELENEVEIQTRQLSLANEKLEHDMNIAKQDIMTAALVQKKLFHPPQKDYSHWDIAVDYKPLAIVSGDFYNFYSMGDDLYGISLFDASGHGVAASLITMLAENIINQAFREANIYGEDLSVTLDRINSNFIMAKGGVENYLTGILLNIREHEDFSTISFVDAAHPYPEVYHSEEAYSEEILPDAENPSFGPIGMDLLDVKYSPISLTLKKNDVLLLFSDGLIEAMNENREEFGRKRIKEILCSSDNNSAEEILNKITAALQSHLGNASYNDDITVIVMKRK
ncbi:MAG: SpoIIE family protein phosphatase [Treponema sp.]|nr:SpoIIE family protein phosphatase [Treponema sp.]